MIQPFGFKESLLWRRSIDLAIGINHVMRIFPEEERNINGLCCQLLEAAIRIPARIAESHDPYFREAAELLQQARFHLRETELLLDLSRYRGYLSDTEHVRIQEKCMEIREMLNLRIGTDA